jgi:hypothetical protein
MFEYAPSSSASAALTRQPVESAAVQGLLAHDEEQDDSNEFIDIDAFDDEALIDPQLRSTTQLGILRIEESSDTYCPGTLPPRLHQKTPFSRGIESAPRYQSTALVGQLRRPELSIPVFYFSSMPCPHESALLRRPVEARSGPPHCHQCGVRMNLPCIDS